VDLRELILVAVRWSHAAAAAALVGGGAFYLAILDPALRQDGTALELIRKRVDAGFRDLVDVTLVVFVVSGALLTFERLSSGAATTAYVIVLGLKLVLSVLLFRWAVQLRRGRHWHSLDARLMVGSGFLVILLASVLKTLYESALRA
jgi:uncharacterized membrane protein